jgi:hypothetical protein
MPTVTKASVDIAFSCNRFSGIINQSDLLAIDKFDGKKKKRLVASTKDMCLF